LFLNDQETATDLLYYEAIAKTVVNLIRKTPDAPVTIGVHGDWGAGKSSVLKMLESAFEDDDRCREPSWLENIELGAKKAIKRENIDPKYSHV
jgi:tRNA A37 threonylcarbamoyladenosine biosynthesis protein TsaE